MTIRKSIQYPLLLVTLFWLVEFLQRVLDTDWGSLGILPREAYGLIGIICSPFLHGGFSHLFSNSTTFILLGMSMLYFYPTASRKAFPYLYLVTGLGVWIFGRGQVHHIGASGLVYAFASFLFFGGVFRRDRRSWAISCAVALLYHGLLYSIVPSLPGISWESHLSGFLVGFGCAFFFRSYDWETRTVVQEEEAQADGYQNIETPNFKYIYQSK